MERELSYFGEFMKDHFRDSVSRDAFDMLCGKPLGFGIGRIVFEHATDKSLVLKFECDAGSFQNIHEWDLWKQHSHAGTSTVDWLAPCVSISPNGIVLVQKRTKKVPWTFKLPKMVPNILDSDLKRDNWGLYKGKLVCHDYGRHNAIHAASKARGTGNMVRAYWIGASQRGYFVPCYGNSGATGKLI